MEKKYTFKVTSKIYPHSDVISISKVIATSISDAKGRHKMNYPKAKIIACVKEEEYIPLEDNSIPSFGGAILGLATVASIALTAKLFGSKEK